MPDGNAGLVRQSVSPEVENELRVKKGVGALDAVLLSIGFTTTNLQHIITPVAQGGLGIGLASAGAAITSFVIISVSTIVIAGLLTYYVFHLTNQSANEAATLLEKQKKLSEKQIIFFARLMYVRHLMSMTDHMHSMQWNDQLKKSLGLNQEAAKELADTVETIYREEKGLTQIIRQRDVHAESEEKIIQRYFHEHSDTYLPRIQQGLSSIYRSCPTAKKSWRPEFLGMLAGFVSFMGMSSGFIGTYYGVVSLATSMAAVSLVVPILGWVILGSSLLFGLIIALAVRRYTDKSMQRQQATEQTQEQEARLSESLDKIHDIEMILLNQRVVKLEQKHTDMPKKNTLTRSHSWSGAFFDRHKAQSLNPEPITEPRPSGSVTTHYSF